MEEFWESQWVTGESLRQLRSHFKQFLSRGLDTDHPGIRFDPDLSSKKDTPETTLRMANSAGGELRRVTIRSGPNQDKKVQEFLEECLETDWPEEGMIQETGNEKSVLPHREIILSHAGHFKGNWEWFEGASVSLTELSFTKLGFPFIEFLCPNETPAELEWLRDGRHAVQEFPAQEAQISGRSWKICPDQRAMALPILAFCMSQVIHGHDLPTHQVAQYAATFPQRYTGPWPTTTWTNWSVVGKKMLYAQFHIRYLSTSKSKIVNSEHECPGLEFKREWGTTATPEFPIVETRLSIAILTSLWHPPPYYTLVTLTDDPEFSVDCIENPKTWEAMGFRPCEVSTGIVIYQVAISRLIIEWSEKWNTTLNSIMSIYKFEIGNILDPETHKRILSGHSDDKMARSIARQLLFRSRHMIRESTDDLHSFVNDLNNSISRIVPESVRENWNVLFGRHQRFQDKLIERIESKLAELDSIDISVRSGI